MIDGRNRAETQGKRHVWRTPVLSGDSISDVTRATIISPGDDGLDSSPGYETTGNPS